eukprot:TRINITY_DN4997_c0_g2_i5.p1 TRINITY_DN4997_c0_g2~~TRINITY_DN4997_c0_g2_i5.p1  ORF type:complete len:194 (-),score=33.68 TRINITY_DN4997_c0_g2_i5:379-960(-)
MSLMFLLLLFLSFVGRLFAQVDKDNYILSYFAFKHEKWPHGAGPLGLTSPALGFDEEGQRLYVVGGKVGKNLSSNFYQYDFNSSEWFQFTFEQLFDISCYSQNQRDGGDIFIFSGDTGSIYQLNLTEKEVRDFPEFQGPFLTKPGCTVVSSEFLLFGGTSSPGNDTNDSTCHSDLISFSESSGWTTWTSLNQV